MSTIKSVHAREIIDSRGNLTIEVTCEMTSGVSARASVPSGASVGSNEALELRDHDPERYRGMGVLSAVQNVNVEICEFIKGREFNQTSLDGTLIKLDGTENKSRLGANAMLGVSLAFARARAQEDGLELYEYLGKLAGNRNFKMPQPMLNIINGGKHARNELAIQEFMIAPVGFKTFKEKIKVASEIISSLKKILLAGGHAVSVGDEGGFAPQTASSEEPLKFLVQAITTSGYSTQDVKIGLDAAASNFYDHDLYRLKIAGQMRSLTGAEMIDWYEKLVDTYPIVSIEDGLAEEDWDGFVAMTKRLGQRIKIVGDDLTVTNLARIKMAVKEKAVNCVLIKPNQIGTLTETIEAVKLTKAQGWATFVSHRSGETMDTFIADLAVGLSCDYIKSGSLWQKERVCKYDRLIEIENKINRH
ncbi:MAG: phosphopyruvate hydratase [Patescibacteria group bacterium]